MKYLIFLKDKIFYRNFALVLVLLLLCAKDNLRISSAKSDAKRKSQKSHLMKFGGNRNRSHFKLLKDPKLSKYFAPNFVWHLSSFKDQAEFLKMTSMLRRSNPDIVLGSYASACTTIPRAKDTFPPTTVALEECEPDWFLHNKDDNNFVIWGKTKDRYYLDIRLKKVRQTIIELAVARANHNDLDAVCFDNCYWGLPHSKASISNQEWTDAFMKFYREAGHAAHEADLKCIVNVATYPSQIIPAFLSIAPYVDGMMTEIAFHPNMRTPELLIRELKGYEELLKQGKIVLLGVAEKKDEQFALLAIWPLARKYGSIYLSVRGLPHDEPLYWLAGFKFDIGVDCEEVAQK